MKEDNTPTSTTNFLFTEDIVKKIAWTAYLSRTTEDEFRMIHRKSPQEVFEKWWNVLMIEYRLPNANISNIIKEIEGLSGEHAWIHHQGDEGEKLFNISKESFIEGAKTVIEIIKNDTI